jgi:hypothetical protein
MLQTPSISQPSPQLALPLPTQVPVSHKQADPLPGYPRSVLHALAPIGLGTADIESLTSYFCRLAVSHSVSLPHLVSLVAAEVGGTKESTAYWREPSLRGMSESAQDWAVALSLLTTVGGLDRLTLLPCRHAFTIKGLERIKSHWCPECFAADLESGLSPYFRLLWDVRDVNVCHKHLLPLATHCPDCGSKDVRHRANCVRPGWCTKCGGFLGKRTAADAPQSASFSEAWFARQAGLLLSKQDQLATLEKKSPFESVVRTLVTQLDHGNVKSFARRTGLTRLEVHQFSQGTERPSLRALLSISLYSGLDLMKLLTGDLGGWEPRDPDQMMFDFSSPEESQATIAKRDHDWEGIAVALRCWSMQDKPISLRQAAIKLEVSVRQLHTHVGAHARDLETAWQNYRSITNLVDQVRARRRIESECYELVACGRDLSVEEVQRRVKGLRLVDVSHLPDIVQGVRERLDMT